MRAISILILFAGAASAAVPTTFSVQGILRDGAGHLQSMTVSASASLWDAQTAGNKLAGDYGPTNVAAMNGLFTMPIDDATLQTKLAGASQVWLEVKVGTETFARQQITSQLFAQMCGTADRLRGDSSTTLADYQTTPATNIDVRAPLTQDRDAWIYLDDGGGAYGNWGIYHRQINTPVKGLPADSIGFIGNSVLRAFINLADGSAFFGGNVGIGTATPAYTLDVSGSARIAGIQLFLKGGNNGTASCTTFCHGANWPGGTGECIGGKDVNTGDYVGCNSTAGAPANWVCICAGIP